jgi:ABC-type multidrug transport system fused ATPase/permease subunit
MPQIPYLFHGTVADNIRLAKPAAALEEVIKAAKEANAHDFIESLPGGYSMQVGERGSRLSGGQRQRIAIARAYLKNAPILILDEPLAHLDKASSELVRASLARLIQGRTVLIIAHRLELATEADRIVVLEKGRVVEEGSHQDLMSARGSYSRLVTVTGVLGASA